LPRETFSTPFGGKSEPVGVTFNYYLKKKPAGDVTIQIHQGAVKITEIKGTAEAGLNSVLWPMTRERAAGAPAGRQRQMTQMNLEDIPEEYREQYLRMRGGPPVGEGVYKVTLTVDGKAVAGLAEVRRDPGAAK